MREPFRTLARESPECLLSETGAECLAVCRQGLTWNTTSDYIVLQAQNDSIHAACKAGCGCTVAYGNTIQLPNGTLVSTYCHDNKVGAATVISVVRWTLPAP